MEDAAPSTRRINGFIAAIASRAKRLRWGDLVLAGLSAAAVFMLVTLLGQLDFREVWESLSEAMWIPIVLGGVVGQLVYVTEASGMLFATGRPLPLVPLAVLQLAVRWIGLAVPSAAGRVGMNAVFLTRLDVPPTIAVVQGALDGGAGFVVESILLLVGFLLVDLSLEPDISVRWEVVLLVVVVAGAAFAIATWKIRRLKEIVVPVLRDTLWMVIDLGRDPKRLLGLLASNLATRMILGFTLWLVLLGVDQPLAYPAALLVTVATNLLAGLVPVPGGIGVAEAALTSFLVLAGLQPEDAFAAAVVYRVMTFYLPAPAGWGATRWLRSNGYV